MSLSPGTRLGPYEVLGPLGEGGMGEVYRARDGRLERDVAVKVITAGLARDRERVKRFEREARAAGALNHPNVLSVFDVGVHDDTPYLVTELLEGETLRSRLRRGPLPVHKAMAIARDIARGLDAAHTKGIIHRDLKPENVFLTRDGRAKILDFGVAKLTHRDRGPAAESSRTESMTESGVIVGTVGYMAPEQVNGDPVDHRVDLFALGCLLYEMLTGRQTFQGKGSVDTLHAILHDEPPDLSEARADVPRDVAVVAHHCLEKDPALRFQSARDAAFAFENISATSGSVLRSGGATATQRRRRITLGVGIAALAVVAAAGVLMIQPWQRTSASFEQLTFRRGSLSGARFSPDGGTILYSAAWDGQPVRVYSTRLDSRESSPLPIPDARLLAVSAKGDLAIAVGPGMTFAAGAHTTLATVSLSGGAPREITEDVTEADWSPDGRDLAVVHWYHDRMSLEYPIGKTIWQTTTGLLSPRIAPGGEFVAFVEMDTRGDFSRGYVSVIDRSGRVRRLTKVWETIEGMDWAPNGREVWFTGTHRGNAKELWSVSLEGRQRLLLRTPGGVTLRDVSAKGDALISEDHFRISLLAVPPGGDRERDLSWQDVTGVADISSDGKTLVFTEYSEAYGGQPAIGMRGTDGSPVVHLGSGYAGALSPDGKWVVAIVWGSEPHISLLPTGAGQTRDLDPSPVKNLDWSYFAPDGHHVLFSGAERGHGIRAYEQAVTGGPPRAVTPEGATGMWRMVSPDNSYLMGQVRDSFFLFPIKGGAPRPVMHLDGDDMPIGWTDNGHSVLVSSPRNILPVRVDRVDLTTGERRLVRNLMPSDPAGVSEIVQILFTPDARAWAYSYRRYLSDLYLVRGLE